MLTVLDTFLQAIFTSQHLSISEISQLLLTRFCQNFKGSVLGPSLTDNMITFVQATYVPATLVHISNISIVNDHILTKRLEPYGLLCGDLNLSVFFFVFDKTLFAKSFNFYQSRKIVNCKICNYEQALIFAKVIK